MELELFDKLWQTSFSITGFAVAQALAYLYATEKEPIADRIRSKWLGVSIAIVVFHAAYIYAIWWCHDSMAFITTSKIQDGSYTSILHGVRLGQQLFVASLGSFALFITITNRKHKNAA